MKPTLRYLWPRLLSLLSLALLSACGGDGVPEVKRWMEQVRRETQISIPKLAEPKRFIPYTYDGKIGIDPYNAAKLTTAFAKLPASSGSLLKPDLERRREPLESYPLDALKMVGTVERAGKMFALLQIDRAIYQVNAGHYIGQNLGQITAITEAAIELREIVQDAAGDWVERKARIELQETKK